MMPWSQQKRSLNGQLTISKTGIKVRCSYPPQKSPLVGGFSVDAIKYMLGGRFRASFRPLNDAIIADRIHGLVGIVGCNNPKTKMDGYINILTRELIKRNVLVLKTGCAAIASGKEGNVKTGSRFGTCRQRIKRSM